MTGDETQFQPDRAAIGAAIFAVAATYFFFLIFAEFALLQLAEPLAGEDAWRLRGLMTGLGAGGIAGSMWAALRFRVESWQALLSWSFRACGVAALLGLVASSWPVMLGAAIAVGLALGCLTVTLATGLRPAVGTGKLGWVIGWGTGLAYAACNLPVIFESSARAQTVMAALVVGLGSIASPFLTPREPSLSMSPEYRPAGLLRWVVGLMMLVWLDSAAFYVIQHEDSLREVTWSGSAHLWVNLAVHAVVAVGVGVLADRGGRSGVLAGALVLLVAACLMLGGAGRGVASWVYAAGVSAYSVMLVYFPARSGRAWVGALVYGVAGWLGSALGIGMAQNLNAVPPWFLAVAVLVVGAMLAWRWRALAMLGVLALAGSVTESFAGEVAPALVARGREVYIAEGCIHCHSQYVRPGSTDEARWGGSARQPESPPLYGNRRQGPDLATVGRRLPLAEWHRRHLMAPRELNPRSRMPSYAHLFSAGDDRGDALVAYLLTLGDAPHEE